MATIKMDYSYCNDKASNIQEKAGEIDKKLKTLATKIIEGINDGTWSGPDAENFKTAWQNCSEEFDDFVKYLKSTSEKVEFASKEVQALDVGGK